MTSIDLNDYKKHPEMTRWFSISVLLNSAKQAILSGMFCAFADRRLIHAALDDIYDANLSQQIDFTKKIQSNNNEIWIDYVSDLGDGFDSTYTIAYLLAKNEIKIDENILPRGQLLIMGGDQIYPTPTKDDYKYKLENPYAYAFPKINKDTSHPALFMIPGNHDWYDGMNVFLAKYCHGKVGFFGSSLKSNWKLFQHRSYFAVKLPNNWWVLGVDTQLGDDIDRPQSQFFETISKDYIKDESAKIILCTSGPTWLYDEKKFDTGIGSIVTDIIKTYNCNAKIYCVLTGDLHNYNRYEIADLRVPKTQFITAGGGGAFLHPTHHLEDESTNIYWLPPFERILISNDQSTLNNFRTIYLKLENDSIAIRYHDGKIWCSLNSSLSVLLDSEGISKDELPNKIWDQIEDVERIAALLGITQIPGKTKLKLVNNNHAEACFPSREESKKLTNDIWWKFPLFNLEFCGVLGIAYSLIAIALLKCQIIPSTNFFKLISSPIFWSMYLILGTLFSCYALHEDSKVTLKEKCKYGFIHAFPHLICVSLFTAALFFFGSKVTILCTGQGSFLDWFLCNWLWFLLIVSVFLTAGFMGGFIWGFYLFISSRYKRHHNDSFSCMRLTGYKNFLRMCIKEDTLTIYPIGIEKILNRDDWRPNDEPKSDNNSKVIPKKEEPKYRLIENEPIVINLVDQNSNSSN